VIFVKKTLPGHPAIMAFEKNDGLDLQICIFGLRVDVKAQGTTIHISLRKDADPRRLPLFLPLLHSFPRLGGGSSPKLRASTSAIQCNNTLVLSLKQSSEGSLPAIIMENRQSSSLPCQQNSSQVRLST